MDGLSLIFVSIVSHIHVSLTNITIRRYIEEIDDAPKLEEVDEQAGGFPAGMDPTAMAAALAAGADTPQN
eukprot:scaffold18391_cov76-Amphora_coffeaeformis.AAC.1